VSDPFGRLARGRTACRSRDKVVPDFAHTIFEKIEKASAFVADLTIINSGAGGRVPPNPNMLIELGYAIHALKKEAMVLVMNTVNGSDRERCGQKLILNRHRTSGIPSSG
jgi:hypothetical protein